VHGTSTTSRYKKQKSPTVRLGISVFRVIGEIEYKLSGAAGTTKPRSFFCGILPARRSPAGAKAWSPLQKNGMPGLSGHSYFKKDAIKVGGNEIKITGMVIN
jgi:hypothetical protein